MKNNINILINPKKSFSTNKRNNNTNAKFRINILKKIQTKKQMLLIRKYLEGDLIQLRLILNVIIIFFIHSNNIPIKFS